MTDEQRDDDYEPVGPDTTKVKKARGRPRNENYLSWEEARDFVRGEMIPSRGKYFEWWERNKPKTVPRFPYRVYVNDWVSWNDFLGTDNKFSEKRTVKWRPLDEAVLWVHTLKLKSYNEWIDYCRDVGLPEDIPARPELVYDGWRSWPHWLGNKPVEVIHAQQQAVKNYVYYVIHERDVPENVLTFGVETRGLTGMKERWEHEHFDIVKMFWFDPACEKTVRQIVDTLSTSYLGMESQRVTPNVWEIVWHLQSQLETITKYTRFS